MNFGKGLKRIVNIPFWIWILLGLLGLFYNLDDFLIWITFGIIAPIILRLIIFYIIDGFLEK